MNESTKTIVHECLGWNWSTNESAWECKHLASGDIIGFCDWSDDMEQWLFRVERNHGCCESTSFSQVIMSLISEKLAALNEPNVKET